MAKQNVVLIFATSAFLVTIFYSQTNEATLKRMTESYQAQVKKTASILTLEDCQCHRITDLYPSQSSIKTPLSNTTCSEAAHRRGEHQKVIAFSYYESDDKMSSDRIKTGIIQNTSYIEGIQINIDRLQKYFPGVRIMNMKSKEFTDLCFIYRFYSEAVSQDISRGSSLL